MPSTDTIPRDGSFPLVIFGKTKKVQETFFSATLGRTSFVVVQIIATALVLELMVIPSTVGRSSSVAAAAVTAIRLAPNSPDEVHRAGTVCDWTRFQ